MHVVGEVEDHEVETEEFVVDAIMDSQVIEGVVRYLVRWEDFPDPKDWTWEPYRHLEGIDAFHEFHRANPDKPRDARYKAPKRSTRRRR